MRDALYAKERIQEKYTSEREKTEKKIMSLRCQLKTPKYEYTPHKKKELNLRKFIIPSLLISFGLMLIIVIALAVYTDFDQYNLWVAIPLVLIGFATIFGISIFSFYVYIYLMKSHYVWEDKYVESIRNWNISAGRDNPVIMAQIESLNNKRSKLESDYNVEMPKIEKIIEDLYSHNIIPEQYRYDGIVSINYGIKYVDYLYNLMRTSKVSYEYAIKSLQDKEAWEEYKEELISYQQIMQEQLDKQRRTTREQLDQIQSSSENAEYYSRMGACYSAVSVFFSASSFLRE